MKTAIEIQAWLTQQIAGILGAPEDDIGLDDTFDSFGLASRDAVSLSGDLEDYLSRRLSPTLLYQYPTIHALAEHLSEVAARSARPAPASAEVTANPTLDEVTFTDLTDAEAEALLLNKLTDLDR